MTPKQETTPFALAMANEGLDVRIVSLCAGRNLDRRLNDLGLNIGTRLSIVLRQGSGLVVSRGQTRVAVGGGMAMKIMVVPT